MSTCADAIKSGNTFERCNSVCKDNLYADRCTKCLCRMCENIDNLGEDITDEARKCCQTTNCFDINESPGCFDKCTGGVDTSSYSSDIFKNCCGSPEHQACCAQVCQLGPSAYVPATLQQKLRFGYTPVKSSVNGVEDPIDAFCRDKIGFRSRSGAVTYDQTQPYCQQPSIIGMTGFTGPDGKSIDPLVFCTCGETGICKDSTDWETCVLFNADKVMNCLKNLGGDAMTQGINEMDGLFCQHQTMGFNCRSCLICNYGNLNEDIKRRFNPSPTPTQIVERMTFFNNKKSNMLENIIFGIVIILILISILVIYYKLIRNRTCK